MYDAIVVGAGPNGLAAAIELARAGVSVLVREANGEVGGASRSMELTLPGFIHDPFSAIYPLAAGSPYLSRLPLHQYGLEWVQSSAPLAHPLGDGSALLLERSVSATGTNLRDRDDRYARLVEPFARDWDRLAPEILGPLRWPDEPLLLARFGMRGFRSAASLLGGSRINERVAALLAGNAAHSGLPLEATATASFALVLHAAGHAVGWPIPAGGAGRLTAAMAAYLVRLGGTIETGQPVHDIRELPPSRVIVLDLTPRQVLRIAGSRLPHRYRRRLGRFRYGLGAFKIDWALSAPVPWHAPDCLRATTVHLGGSMAEIGESMRRAWRGEPPVRPFVILAQPSLHDPSRAPAGHHTAWAYCHVPNGWMGDATDAIETQVERFAPGFREVILGRSVLPPRRLEEMDANLVGGDVNGGSAALPQLFFRPMARLDPYSTPLPGLFICSASTPPGGGVHGMCGYHAARSVLRWMGREKVHAGQESRRRA